MTDQKQSSSDRPLRLFGRKKGKKLRAGRQAIMDRMIPALHIDIAELSDDPISLQNLFSKPMQAYWLEIGFGGGEHLLELAKQRPDIGFIGCEPFQESAAKLVMEIEAQKIDNVRLYLDDARPLIAALPDASIDRAFLLFPDPWPKTRHHKRRFVNGSTVQEMSRVLKSDAEWRIASDIMGYIDWTLRWMAQSDAFRWTARCPADWRRRPQDWPPTRYEAKAINQGRAPVFLRFQRQ